jgi:hypothetical protein
VTMAARIAQRSDPGSEPLTVHPHHDPLTTATVEGAGLRPAFSRCRKSVAFYSDADLAISLSSREGSAYAVEERRCDWVSRRSHQ